VNPEAVTSMVDRDLTTRWDSGPQIEGMRVEIDLGIVHTVHGIDISLGRFVEDFPRGLVIEVSEEGHLWRETWRGSSAGMAVWASLDPRGTVPVRYRFPPTQARLLRMRLTASDKVYYWSIAELQVLQP
jgi:hypothetical protein